MNNDSSPHHNVLAQSPESSSKSNTGRDKFSLGLGLKTQTSSNNQVHLKLGPNQYSNNNNNISSSIAQNEKGEQMGEVIKIGMQLEDIITDLDKKLNRVLAKQEYEYLKGYNIYVKRKEKELRELIEKLNEKNSNNTLKDEKINNLEKTIHAIRDDQIKQEKEKETLNEKIKYWKTKALGYEQEKNFLQAQIMDAKRQNKLLKLAIGRLQNELEKKEGEQSNIVQGEGNVKVFLTENQFQQPEQAYKDKYTEYGGLGQVAPQVHDRSLFVDNTTAPTSILEAGWSKFSAGQNPKTSQPQRRVMTRSPVSRYRHIPTENIKFSKFLELIFKSKMTREDIRDEISKYVQVLETTYNDTIKELRLHIDREKNKSRKMQGDKVNESTEKNELEGLFVDCIEEVRKDIMKRRLKNEIYNKKKFQQIEKNSEEAKEFEESLLRLAQLAKNRIKLSDFTQRDKCNLLDLFVNNEKTLLKIYEALFPHRAQNSGPNLQSQNQLGQPIKERQITLKNSQISQQLSTGMHYNPYQSHAEGDTAAETKHDQKFAQLLPQIGEYRNGTLASSQGPANNAGKSSQGIIKDLHNNTMVEFGSIRQSIVTQNNNLDNSFKI